MLSVRLWENVTSCFILFCTGASPELAFSLAWSWRRFSPWHSLSVSLSLFPGLSTSVSYGSSPHHLCFSPASFCCPCLSVCLTSSLSLPLPLRLPLLHILTLHPDWRRHFIGSHSLRSFEVKTCFLEFPGEKLALENQKSLWPGSKRAVNYG